MTHECHALINQYLKYQQQKQKCVLATVVQLNGSSYRKPGVRMLISDTNEMTGALSGGCVEKEVILQSKSVFETNIAKIIKYDGRYRLGCEGEIFILIEPFQPDSECLESYHQYKLNRKPFVLESYFNSECTSSNTLGSQFVFDEVTFKVHAFSANEPCKIFRQTLKPNFRLLIFGHEHDAEHLCRFAHFCGWDVEIISSKMSGLPPNRFQEAKEVHYLQPEEIKSLNIDSETACVLMSHNFAKDLAYLQRLSLLGLESNYIGVLGAKKRMNQLESTLMNTMPNLNPDFYDQLHGPVGLDVGSITPQEIAISIIAEITQFVRQKKVILVDEAQE